MNAHPRILLGDLVKSVDYGVTASAIQQPAGPKFLRITDIQDGSVDWSQVPWCECSQREIIESALKPGDIVFARTGATTGKSFLIRECPESAVFASYLIRVRLGKQADPGFVSHFFQTSDYWSQITKNARGAAQPGVNATTLRSLEIPLPPLTEQRYIVEILDRTEALRAKRRAALAKLDTLAKSIFLDMFGDPSSNLKGWAKASIVELIEPVETWNPLRTIPDDEFEYIDISSIDQGKKIITKPKKFKCNDAPSRARQLVRSGDILVSTVRPNLNAVAVVPAELDGATASTGFCVLRPNKALLASQYLFSWVRSNAFISEMVRRATGASYPAVTDGIVCSSILYLPPINLQTEFARRVEAIEKLKSTHRASLNELDALFASLQNRAFRGEL